MTPRRRPASAEQQDKRRRILAAAARVFARKGYFGARVSEIAKRAGVADGTVYLYFHNKEDVLACLFEEVMAEHIAAARAELRLLPDGAARLRHVAERHLRLLGSNPDLAVVFQVELRQSTKFMERFTASSFQDYLKVIEGIIDEAQREGTLRSDLSRKLLSKALFGILDEMVTSWILGRRDYDLGKLADPVVDIFLNGASARVTEASRTPRRAAAGRGGRPA